MLLHRINCSTGSEDGPEPGTHPPVGKRLAFSDRRAEARSCAPVPASSRAASAPGAVSGDVTGSPSAAAYRPGRRAVNLFSTTTCPDQLGDRNVRKSAAHGVPGSSWTSLSNSAEQVHVAKVSSAGQPEPSAERADPPTGVVVG